MTWSTMPNRSAPSAVIKLSRSSASSIDLWSLPVCSPVGFR
jgi:hypothetical protein